MEVARQTEVKGGWWDLGPIQPDTSFHHAPPPVKKYSSTHTRVCTVHILPASDGRSGNGTARTNLHR